MPRKSRAKTEADFNAWLDEQRRTDFANVWVLIAMAMLSRDPHGAIIFWAMPEEKRQRVTDAMEYAAARIMRENLSVSVEGSQLPVREWSPTPAANEKGHAPTT